MGSESDSLGEQSWGPGAGTGVITVEPRGLSMALGGGLHRALKRVAGPAWVCDPRSSV